MQKEMKTPGTPLAAHNAKPNYTHSKFMNVVDDKLKKLLSDFDESQNHLEQRLDAVQKSLEENDLDMRITRIACTAAKVIVTEAVESIQLEDKFGIIQSALVSVQEDLAAHQKFVLQKLEVLEEQVEELEEESEIDTLRNEIDVLKNFDRGLLERVKIKLKDFGVAFDAQLNDFNENLHSRVNKLEAILAVDSD